MPQQSTLESTAPVPDAKPPGGGHIRRKWFPAVWTLGIVAAAVSYQFTEATRDFKTVVTIAAGVAILVGLSVWFVLCFRAISAFRRALIALAFWGLLFGVFQSIDLINDGDNRIVGWRFIWQPKPDQLLDVPRAANEASGWEPSERDYPQFLGTGYWAEVTGVALETDWQAHPPEEIWRRDIGAGWSAFAIVDDYAITQEQRGENEMVVCYRVSTGEIVWTHADQARFDPKSSSAGLGGLGPRATPTIHGNRVFTQGATGIVNCLDARSGKVLWSHHTLEQQGADNLMWGKSGSPLVVDDLGIVVVNVGAPAGAKQQESYESSLVAYDLESGKIRWAAGHRTTAYSSPVLATLAGERQILQINENFLTAHRADDGKVLWEHPWNGSSSGNASCSQPVPVGDDRLFLSKGYGHGASLLRITRDDGDNWLVRPEWQPPVKPVMKTKLGNVVVRDQNVYGLDGVLLQCVDLDSGSKRWKKRRNPPFGHGQLMLIGDVILILSEIGELALVECTPDGFHELAAIQVFDDGDVTWNNPAFSAPYLLIRNAREAACYRLPVKGSDAPKQKPLDEAAMRGASSWTPTLARFPAANLRG